MSCLKVVKLTEGERRMLVAGGRGRRKKEFLFQGRRGSPRKVKQVKRDLMCNGVHCYSVQLTMLSHSYIHLEGRFHVTRFCFVTLKQKSGFGRKPQPPLVERHLHGAGGSHNRSHAILASRRPHRPRASSARSGAPRLAQAGTTAVWEKWDSYSGR